MTSQLSTGGTDKTEEGPEDNRGQHLLSTDNVLGTYMYLHILAQLTVPFYRQRNYGSER